MAYFIAGHMVADWLDRECDVMLAQADAEEDYSFRFWLRGMTEEANWHAETAEILRSNARVCQRTAGWLRRQRPSGAGLRDLQA